MMIVEQVTYIYIQTEISIRGLSRLDDLFVSVSLCKGKL